MTSLTLAQAATIIDAALKKARAANMKPIAISVLDPGGHLVAYQREDTSSTMRFQISSGKANACLAMGMGGRALLERSGQMPVFMNALQAASGGRFFPMVGGVLVRDGAGEIVGAVGVSGDTSDNDEAAALAGIEAAGLKADVG
ncbi:MAG TPA: heme-binding protein [Xanthobacteraceae bacterium]|nr:heme-binding protein [Xanthobacteraceae bacterium]